MAAGRWTRLMMALVQLVSASGETRRYALANGETIIGRRPDCRIVMDAPAIRHRHARLFSVDGSTVIHGIDDAWPVYVNGEPVQRRVLADGDEIELGPYRMRYFDDSRPERADDTPAAPDPAGDRDTDAPANQPIPGPFTPAVEDDPLPESRPTSAGEHDESEDATPLFFGPMTDTADPHEPADDDDRPDPASAGPDPEQVADDPGPEAAVEHTDPQWTDDEAVPPADDDVDPESTTDEAVSATPADEDELESLLDAIHPRPHADDTDPGPADEEIDPYEYAVEPDQISGADTIDPQPTEAELDLQPHQDETEPRPAADELDHRSELNPMAAQPAGDTSDSMPSVKKADSRPAADSPQPDTGPDYHLDILTGINQGRRVTLTRDLVVLGFNRQRLVALHNDAGVLTLRRVDDEAVAHLNGAPISDEPTEVRPGDVISLQRIDLRIHEG